MLLLGIYDIITLSTSGFTSGVLAILGISICEATLLHYFMGCVMFGE